MSGDVELRLTDAERRALIEAVHIWCCDYGDSELTSCVEDIIAARLEAAEGALRRVANVHARYFDLDGEPGFDDTTPEPEDVWRYDRDFRAALGGGSGQQGDEGQAS